MPASLNGRTVLVIGRPSGIARAVALSIRKAGGSVVVAGRDQQALAAAYDDPAIRAERVDLTDEASIAALAERLGRVDHVVSTASARARGAVGDLDHDTVLMSFSVKVVGPMFLAKHFAPRMPADGSFVLFSGSSARKPAAGMLAVGATNAAVDVVTRTLAVELAPIRVNAISPGTVDTGAYDGLGEARKAELFTARQAGNPARRIGNSDDIADAVMFALTNTFMTGVSLSIDGGEPLV
ncbi:SDR family oxidoreductase [Rugosimonospora africana]|uniref:Short-chain dehydrogenase n=1 Tax=Rugosimonospora africana TaxID=556532 RepID=A0A8J3QUC7_9ACTN|nr:SDR family oxidoreductase [Rugosimonospora africana]GIH16968.1 short-chain dehydrogenase [Rugosimonospora africana]